MHKYIDKEVERWRGREIERDIEIKRSKESEISSDRGYNERDR